MRCWWAGSTEVSCPLVVGAVEGGGERRKERQFTGGVREKKCERSRADGLPGGKGEKRGSRHELMERVQV